MQFPPAGARVIDALVVWKRSHNFKLASAHRHFCGVLWESCLLCTLSTPLHRTSITVPVGDGSECGSCVQQSTMCAVHHACAGVDMRDAHTALADATATLQVIIQDGPHEPTCLEGSPSIAPPSIWKQPASSNKVLIWTFMLACRFCWAS